MNRFASRLLAWFEVAGRKQLPWQKNPTPYRVWISEIMLQQTQVAAVIPYYHRFMERFSGVHDLAQAPLDEVLHLWTGLGYYARARNLHRAAQFLVSEHEGQFPMTLEAMQALPGIGRSTAGAILSLASGQRHSILDGNVKRVVARYFGVVGFPGDKKIETRLWQLADACTPRERVAEYTQAIMDLGATVCMRARPNCGECPVAGDCVAMRDNLQSILPTRRPKRLRPQRKAFAVVAVNSQGSVLLQRRPASGLWGGLWTFPQFEDETQARVFLGSATSQSRFLPVYHHSFTHFDLELQPLLLRNALHPQVADNDTYCWYDVNRPPRIGLAKPAVEIIRRLAQTSEPCEVIRDS